MARLKSKRNLAVLAILAIVALFAGLFQALPATAADEPFTVSVTDGPDTRTNSTALYNVTIACRDAAGCADAVIDFTRPTDGQGNTLQGNMVISLASGSNPAILFTAAGLNGDTPRMTFTRLDNNQSVSFTVSWGTNDGPVRPGTYTTQWKGAYPKANYSASGSASVHVEGTVQDVKMQKSMVPSVGTTYDGALHTFQLSWQRRKNSSPGLTGATAVVVDQLPAEYKFLGFTEDGIGRDQLARDMDGNLPYRYDEATHQVILDITESVDEYFATRNASVMLVRYRVQVDPEKTANVADGTRITNTAKVQDLTSLNPDQTLPAVPDSSVATTYRKTRPISASKARSTGEYWTTSTETDANPDMTYGYVLSTNNPGNQPGTLTIDDTIRWGNGASNAAITVPEGENGTSPNYHYLTSIRLNPVVHNNGETISYPANLVGYRADGTTKNYYVPDNETLRIPAEDQIVRFVATVENFRNMDALPETNTNGVLTVAVTYNTRIETNQIIADGTSRSIRLYNQATYAVSGQRSFQSSFYTVYGDLPNPYVTVAAVNTGQVNVSNLQAGQTFNLLTSLYAADKNSGPSRPEMFLDLPAGFTLGSNPAFQSTSTDQCQAQAADWAFEKLANRNGGEVWRIYLKDPDQKLDARAGLRWLHCYDLPVTVAHAQWGTYNQASLDNAKQSIQAWVHEEGDKLAHATMSGKDTYDVDRANGDTGQWRFSATSVTVGKSSAIGVSKTAKGDADEEATFWSADHDQTSLVRKNADFTLTASTTGTAPLQNMVVYDFLPAQGTTNLVDGQTNADVAETTFAPVLAGPVRPAAGNTANVTIMYSTKADPCRPELSANATFPAGCSISSDWSTQRPADLSQVTAIRIVFNEAVFGDFDFIVPMTLPTANFAGESLSTADVATNRVAAAGRTDTGGELAPVGPAYARIAPSGSLNLDKSAIIADVPNDTDDGLQTIRRDDEFYWVVDANADRDGAVVADPTITDNLPVGVDFVEIGQTGAYDTTGEASYDQESRTITWQPGDVAPGTPARLFIKVKATGSSTITNTVTREGGQAGETPQCQPSADGNENCDQHSVHVDAGTAVISGKKFADVNRNNVFNDGDTPRAGDRVILQEQRNGQWVTVNDPAVTGEDGAYEFTGLPAGTYRVLFAREYFTTPVEPNQGNDDSVDSDVLSEVTISGETFDATESFRVAEGQNREHVDAGVLLWGAVSGQVFDDLNGDGQKQDDEPTMTGVQLELLTPDGKPVAGKDPVATGEDGTYRFVDVVPGTYQVKVVLPNGDTHTYTVQAGTEDNLREPGYSDGASPDSDTPGVTRAFEVAEGEVPNIDFGLQKFAQIAGTVWQDNDGDSYQNDEPGLGDVTVKLLKRTADGLDDTGITATTGSDGRYTFDKVVPGNYAVQVIRDGAVFSPMGAGNNSAEDDGSDAASDGTIVIGSVPPDDTSNQYADAGIMPTSTLSGMGFYDDNRDGQRQADQGERNIRVPVTVNVYRDGEDEPIATTQTRTDGTWSVDGITPGDYRVEMIRYNRGTFGSLAESRPGNIDAELFNDFTQNAAGNGTTPVFQVRGGAAVPNIDAGFVRTQDISGAVWSDANNNGTWDDGEEPLAGVTVGLTNAQGQNMTARTNADGVYQFHSVFLGQATVTVSKPEMGPDFPYGTQFSPTTGGAQVLQDEKKSDVTPADGGATATVTFDVIGYENADEPEAADIQHVDAGIVSQGTVSGTVFVDWNKDGIKNGVPGTDPGQERTDNAPAEAEQITAILRTADGTEVARTQVTADGEYSFGPAAPGEYYVEFEVPDGDEITQLNDKGDDTPVDEAVNDVNPDTKRTDTFTVKSGAGVTTIDMGVINFANITGIAWVDANDNGVREDGEDFFTSGAVVSLYNAETGERVSSALANPQGRYTFRYIPHGRYYLQAEDIAGTAISNVTTDAPLSDPNLNDFHKGGDQDRQTNVFDLASGVDQENVDLGLLRFAGISGTVFRDIDRNGKMGLGETGIENVLVYVVRPATGDYRCTYTNSLGQYFVEAVEGNDYYTIFPKTPGGTPELPEGFVPGSETCAEMPRDGLPEGTLTTWLDEAKGDVEAPGFNDADPQTGQTIEYTRVGNTPNTNIDAGYIVNGGVSGQAFNDLDANGELNGEEQPLSGVTAILLDADGAEVARTATGEDGTYRFNTVEPGTYTVKFEYAGFERGTAFTAGTSSDIEDPNVSDVNAGGQTPQFHVTLDHVTVNVDAGLVEYSTISGQAFRDYNRDGLSDDPADTVLANVTVILQKKQADGRWADVADMSTDEEGQYLFSGLLPGTYRVEFEDPSADAVRTEQGQGDDRTVDSDISVSTGRTGVLAVEAGTDTTHIDAGYLFNGNISGRVWVDTNNDGHRTAGEQSYRAGTLVELLKADGSVYGSFTTGEDGTYTFTEVPAGQYSVRFTLPDGFVFSPKEGSAGTGEGRLNDVSAEGITDAFRLVSGSDVPNVDAGIAPTTTVSGLAFFDSDNDGSSVGEEPRAGVTVTLRNAQNQVVGTTVTSDDGTYTFEGVAPGEYTVQFESFEDASFSPQGSHSDVNSDGVAQITVEAGIPVVDIDAGYMTTGRVSGIAFWDINGDGRFADDEQVRPGTTVRLLGADGESVVADTTVNAEGRYSFNQVAPGDYRVQFLATETRITQKTGDDSALTEPGLNDIDPETGLSTVFEVIAGGVVDNVDGGFRRWNAVSGLAFADIDYDDRKANELGISGVTVTLLKKSSDGAWEQYGDATQTDSNGRYTFNRILLEPYADAPSEEFMVRFEYADGLAFTGGDSKLETLVAGGGETGVITFTEGGQAIADVDAGFRTTSVISGTVFDDADADGVWDEDEDPVAGTRVVLTDADGTVIDAVAPVVTGESGRYRFVVAPGDYRVQFVLPEGSEDAFSPQVAQSLDESRRNDAGADGKTQLISLFRGDIQQSVDAGITQTGAVTGNVFKDPGRDGIKADGEPFAGVTVELLDGDGNVVTTVQTDANGDYRFERIVPGDYTIRVVAPEGYEFSDTGNDSIVDKNGQVPVTVAPRQTVTDQDAGLFQTPEPTPEPTAEPSETPSVEPTAEPSETPTATPTETAAPEPTETPSLEPSGEPTPEPSETPTAEPSETPTATPTETAAPEPTETPSLEPSGEPTPEPSETPTAEPSETPSVEPTAEPSETPTATPTETAAPEPTEPPATDQPSAEPTDGPTGVPTSEQTDEPGAVPSDNPSDSPADDSDNGQNPDSDRKPGPQGQLPRTGVSVVGTLILGTLLIGFGTVLLRRRR